MGARIPVKLGDYGAMTGNIFTQRGNISELDQISCKPSRKRIYFHYTNFIPYLCIGGFASSGIAFFVYTTDILHISNPFPLSISLNVR